MPPTCRQNCRQDCRQDYRPSAQMPKCRQLAAKYPSAQVPQGCRQNPTTYSINRGNRVKVSIVPVHRPSLGGRGVLRCGQLTLLTARVAAPQMVTETGTVTRCTTLQGLRTPPLQAGGGSARAYSRSTVAEIEEVVTQPERWMTWLP